MIGSTVGQSQIHYRYHEHYLDLHWRSLPLTRLATKLCAWAESTIGMHNMKWVGTVDRRGYGGQQKGTICDVRGPYPSIWRTLKPIFRQIPSIVIMSRLDAYILK